LDEAGLITFTVVHVCVRKKGGAANRRSGISRHPHCGRGA